MTRRDKAEASPFIHEAEGSEDTAGDRLSPTKSHSPIPSLGLPSFLLSLSLLLFSQSNQLLLGLADPLLPPTASSFLFTGSIFLPLYALSSSPFLYAYSFLPSMFSSISYILISIIIYLTRTKLVWIMTHLTY